MPEDPRKEPSISSGLGQVMGLSAQMVASTFVGAFIGWLGDRGLGTEPYLLILGIMLGGAGGIVAVWRTWKKLT